MRFAHKLRAQKNPLQRYTFFARYANNFALFSKIPLLHIQKAQPV